jgi:serine/threonine protein kinase
MQLLQLPNLCWVAFSNNPFLAGIADTHNNNLTVIHDPVLDQEDWPVLGQGAGGVTRKVHRKDGEYVAVKTFAGELTSDGSPQDERTISVVASASHHACLISLLGQTSTGSLIMEFLDGYEGLAGPPSMETCSRDVYERKNVSEENAKIIVQGMLQVLTQLHAKGICHGDFYGHNILLQDSDESFRVKLSDFGAAFFYDTAAPYAELVQRIEMRAFGVLVEELYKLSGGKDASLSELAKSCRCKIGTFSDLYEKFQFTV